MVIANKVVTVHVRKNKMGFRKPIDYNSVHHQIYIAGVELYSPRNDGFTAWDIKQDLYKLKWMLDAIIKDAPTFVDEEEFIKEHEQKVMWRTLKE
jgi:hypothetical protein